MGNDVAEGVIVAQRTQIGVFTVPVLLIVLKVHVQRYAIGVGAGLGPDIDDAADQTVVPAVEIVHIQPVNAAEEGGHTVGHQIFHGQRGTVQQLFRRHTQGGRYLVQRHHVHGDLPAFVLGYGGPGFVEQRRQLHDLHSALFAVVFDLRADLFCQCHGTFLKIKF